MDEKKMTQKNGSSDLIIWGKILLRESKEQSKLFGLFKKTNRIKLRRWRVVGSKAGVGSDGLKFRCFEP
jgi:hypothetical protein